MSKIAIGIACHKPSVLPTSSLYLPIHVGSALSNKVLPGLQRDDEGDNISEKNPMYCELTAQYWLWKNVEADYYGLSHYRRFASFAPEKFTNFTHDNRKQVLIGSLNDYTMHKYYLDNEEAMREIIESHDIVATEEQNLAHIYTPRGHQNSVYKHFVAHDHDLINKHDLDMVIEIVKTKWPQYYEDMNEYINAPAFRGFNVFCMKKELFFELCEFEFDVLAELEKVIDMKNYDLTRTRVYGFMAEILYSSFVYHCKKTRGLNVYDAQMLFFEDTDPKVDLEPIPDAMPITFMTNHTPPYLMDVTLSSFLDNMDAQNKYDIIFMGEKYTKVYQKHYQAKVADYPNVSLRFLPWEGVYRALSEEITHAYEVYALCLPWILRKYDRMTILHWNLLFQGDIKPICDFDLKGKLFAAAYDIEWLGRINSVYTDEKDYAGDRLGIQDPYKVFNTAVEVMDLAEFRNRLDIWDIIHATNEIEADCSDMELQNVLYNGANAVLPQEYNLRVGNEESFNTHVADAPICLFKAYQAAKSDPLVVQFVPDDPWWTTGADHEVQFWEYASKSSFSSMYIELMMTFHETEERLSVTASHRGVNKFLPYGSRRRKLVRKFFPYGTPQYNLASNAMNKISSVIRR